MLRDFPKDEAQAAKMVEQVNLRLQASADWYSGHRSDWEECYDRWYRYPERPATVTDADDYEIKLGYAFGLVEQLNSKITEPMLQMGVPFRVAPTEFKDAAAADNFADVCRDFYSKPNVQDGKRRSKKEMIVCGPRWEVDEWMHVEIPGKDWGTVDEIVEQEIVDPRTGQPAMGSDGKPVMAKSTVKVPAEVARKIVTHYGFNTRYPSVFDMYPEPNRITIDTGQKTDVSWIIEDLGELALEDLAREMIYNPATRKSEPRYNFERLLHDAGPRAQERYKDLVAGVGGIIQDPYGPLITPVHTWADVYGNKEATRRKSNDAVALQSFEDRDKIWVCQMRSATEIRTVAQGKYVIERITDPWHRPRLGVRIENYTTDPRSLFGPGALKPILDELVELEISHSLGMQNFFRIVNRMIAVKQKAIVSMDDLDRRAGGVVRISDEVGSIGEAIQSIDQVNVIPDMIGAESNIKGSIEFTSSNLDASPGIHGTRQNHKTAAGLEIIAANIGTRFATMQSQALINEARSGQSMEYMFAQFCFERMPYSRMLDDGTTVYSKFNKDDVYTEGRGFRYLITVDPLWGNSHVQRQDAIEILGKGIEYESLRMKFNDPKMKKVDISILFEDMLKKFGRLDTQRIFYLSSGEVDPDTEFQMLAQGATKVECQGDLQHHIELHLLQAESPALAAAMASGKADPKTKERLLLLVKQDLARIVTFMQDPAGAARGRLNAVGMVPPGRDMMGAGA